MKVSEIEIIYNPVIKPSDRKKISCSKDAAELFRRIWKTSIQHKESFYVLYLNRSNKVPGYHLVSLGGVSGILLLTTKRSNYYNLMHMFPFLLFSKIFSIICYWVLDRSVGYYFILLIYLVNNQ